jgi:hypothetical protein
MTEFVPVVKALLDKHRGQTFDTWSRPSGAVVRLPTTQASAGEKSGGRP